MPLKARTSYSATPMMSPASMVTMGPVWVAGVGVSVGVDTGVGSGVGTGVAVGGTGVSVAAGSGAAGAVVAVGGIGVAVGCVVHATDRVAITKVRSTLR